LFFGHVLFDGSKINRHLSVLYNSDARAAAEKEGILPLDDREADESGAYFHPLLYDAEVIRLYSL
jgi:hypothetical protein